MSDAQERENESQSRSRAAGNVNLVPGMSPDFDPVKTAGKIYPILQFRDRIVKAISRGISMVPGLEKLLDHIGETLTAFILGLLAPFVRPIIQQVSKVLKEGSSTVISSSAKAQMEPWNNPHCSDPTHSMLSKDHFTNVLNSCAGRVAATILQYTVPRILFAWENPNIPVDEVVNDVLRAFHHPALRNEGIEIQRNMFNTVRQWCDEHPRRQQLDHMLSSESVKQGKNHILNQHKQGSSGGHSHGAWDALEQLGHGKVSGSLWSQVRTRDINSMQGRDGNPSNHYMSTSPAPSPSLPPKGEAYGYTNPSYSGGDHSQQAPGGYGAPSQPPAPQYSGYDQPPPPSYGYGGPPPGPQWGGPRPPQGYGGPGYGAPPPQPPYGQPPPEQQQPPQWNQYPGQHHGY